MKISKYYSLEDMTYSFTAKKKGIKNMPNEKEIENLIFISEVILDKLCDHFGFKIQISSGFRSKDLNKAIGGASNSQHLNGEAVDLDLNKPILGVTNKNIFEYIKNNFIFDQLIWEFGTSKNPDWVHVSIKKNGNNRKQILKTKK